MSYRDYLYKNEIEGALEAGAGTGVGDLFCAGVILPQECPYEECQEYWNMIKDSKKLSKKKRELLSKFIKDIAIDYAIAQVSAEEIDIINIYQARCKGFHMVLDKLSIKPTKILVDGTAFHPYYDNEGDLIPHVCIINGDNKFRNIAAASIIAKDARDKYILDLDLEYPVYNWKKNNGYFTKEHIEAIKKYGITKYHRKTFGICKQWKTLPQIYIKVGTDKT